MGLSAGVYLGGDGSRSDIEWTPAVAATAQCRTRILPPPALIRRSLGRLGGVAGEAINQGKLLITQCGGPWLGMTKPPLDPAGWYWCSLIG